MTEELTEEDREMDDLLVRLYDKWIQNYNNLSGQNRKKSDPEMQQTFISEVYSRLLDLTQGGSKENGEAFKLESDEQGPETQDSDSLIG